MPTNKAEWDAACIRVTDAMRTHVKPFVTPLSTIISHDEGELLGSAGYISLLGKILLITNDHNFKDPDRTKIAAQFAGNDGYFRLHRNTYSTPYPFDVGVTLIDPVVWNLPALQPHEAGAVPEVRLAAAHAPVDNELLFFKGFAGEGSKFLFNTLLAVSTSYAGKEVPLPMGWGDERFHFAIDYRPDLATSLDAGYGLPQPKGFSGSLVWNTNYVRAVTMTSTRSNSSSQRSSKPCEKPWDAPSRPSTMLSQKLSEPSLPANAKITSQTMAINQPKCEML